MTLASEDDVGEGVRARSCMCVWNRAEVKKRRMKQGAEDGRKSGVRERERER